MPLTLLLLAAANQLQITADRYTSWHANISFSRHGCLSLFSLHLILSKYRLLSACTWCKSWISHEEFYVGALKTVNASADSVSISGFCMLIPDRTRCHNENKCQRDKDVSLKLDIWVTLWLPVDGIFSPNSAEICPRKLISICGLQSMKQQLRARPVELIKSRVLWKPICLNIYYTSISFSKMISMMIEPRHEWAKVDFLQINIVHGAATPQFQSAREAVGQNRTKMWNDLVTSMIVNKAGCGAEDREKPDLDDDECINHLWYLI